jgi:tetratricopeptide (TPR) repeat protein
MSREYLQRSWDITIRASLFVVAAAGLVLLAGCASGPKIAPAPPPDVEYVNAIEAAESSYSRGLMVDAASLYRRALTRARAMDNPALIGEAAYDLAACEMTIGDYKLASQLLDEAHDEMLRNGDNIADVLLVEAKVARLDHHPDLALQLCGQVLTAPGSKPTDAHRCQIHILRGQIACSAGNLTTAQSELAEAKKLIGAAPAPARSAGLENLAATINERSGKPALAAAGFDREAALYREAGLYRDMVRALGRAGAAYAAAAQFQAAGDRSFRAARSAFAQGDKTVARPYLDAAIAAAGKAADEETLRKAHVLAGELGPATEPSD